MYSRPALSDLINRTLADITSRLPDPNTLRRSDAAVYARALAGVAQGLYGYIDWLSRQLIYDTADSDILERWASIWGITRNAAQAATGSVTFTGSNGAPIPAGTVMAAYDGVLYETTGAASISGTSVVVAVQDVTAEAAGNRLSGQTFTLQTPLSGISASVAAGAMTGGADIETDISLRSRLLARIAQPPQGGDSNDYIEWATSVPNVTRAWVFSNALGAGTVLVNFMMDNTYSNGIPLSGDVTNVQYYINGVRPVTAAVTVAAPVAAPLNFVFSSITPNNSAVQAAVTAELSSLILRESSPGGTILLSHINDAIGVAAGLNDFTLTSPAANVVASSGQITTMGTITW